MCFLCRLWVNMEGVKVYVVVVIRWSMTDRDRVNQALYQPLIYRRGIVCFGSNVFSLVSERSKCPLTLLPNTSPFYISPSILDQPSRSVFSFESELFKFGQCICKARGIHIWHCKCPRATVVTYRQVGSLSSYYFYKKFSELAQLLYKVFYFK